MYVKKACDHLFELAISGPANLATFATVSVLLDGLNAENADCEAGERLNGTARNYIRQVRSWFEILCGVGEDGWTEEKVRSNLRTDVSVLKQQIDNEREPKGATFKRWFEPESLPAISLEPVN
jgi:hypothetical protein